MNNLMIDLETMGNTHNSAIIAIGACFFDPDTGAIGKTFYQQVNLEAAVISGTQMDASTVLWWMQQSDDARAKFKDNHKADTLELVLSNFYNFVKQAKNVKPWGNGATFDLGILSNSFEKAYIKTPWQFWNERDVRTVVELGQAVGFDPKKDMPFEGTPHYALDDAIHQAKYVSAIIGRLTGK